MHPAGGFTILAEARVLCHGHALLRNLRGSRYDRASTIAAATPRPGEGVPCAEDAPTAVRLARGTLPTTVADHGTARR